MGVSCILIQVCFLELSSINEKIFKRRNKNQKRSGLFIWRFIGYIKSKEFNTESDSYLMMIRIVLSQSPN